MNIGSLKICVSAVVPFRWLPHRLTLKKNPPIYHWLWFVFANIKSQQKANE